jgi:hypothetical protein
MQRQYVDRAVVSISFVGEKLGANRPYPSSVRCGEFNLQAAAR